MSADYTTSGLIADTKLRGFFGSGDGLTSSRLLKVLTGQLRNYIPAFLKGLREEFIIAELSIAVTSAVVPIPVRACGVALRTIGWLESSGEVRQLTRIEPERRAAWATSGTSPQGFMFRGNDCILVPAVTSGTLVVAYQQRGGELVLPTDCAKVYAYDDVVTLIVDNLPSSIVVGTVVDIISGSPNFGLISMDAAVISVASIGGGQFDIGFASLPTGIVAGDFVSLATETCVPQIPLECFDLLCQAAAVEVAQSTGSTRLEAIQSGLRDLRASVSMILSPRADSSSRVIVSRSRLGSRRY